MELQRIGEGRNGKFSFQFVLDNGEEEYILRPAAEHARTLMRMIDEAESMYFAQGIGPSSSGPSLDVMGRKRSLVYLYLRVRESSEECLEQRTEQEIAGLRRAR